MGKVGREKKNNVRAKRAKGLWMGVVLTTSIGTPKMLLFFDGIVRKLNDKKKGSHFCILSTSIQSTAACVHSTPYLRCARQLAAQYATTNPAPLLYLFRSNIKFGCFNSMCLVKLLTVLRHVELRQTPLRVLSFLRCVLSMLQCELQVYVRALTYHKNHTPQCLRFPAVHHSLVNRSPRLTLQLQQLPTD